MGMKKACDVYGTTKPPIKRVTVLMTVDDVDESYHPWEADLSDRAIKRLKGFIVRGMRVPTPKT